MKISATTVNPLAYKGDVEISFICNGVKLSKTLHNSGTQFFLDVITQFLAGYDVSSNIPKYIDVQDDSQEGNKSVLKRRIPLTGVVWGPAASTDYNGNAEPVNAKSSLKLTTVITNNDKSAVSQLTAGAVRILDAHDNILCEIKDTETNDTIKRMWEAINATTDAIIDWKLTFQNNSN